MVEVMKIMATSFKRSHACTAWLSAPNPAAGHCWPMPLPETAGHSRASLGQSFVGHCSFLLGPGVHKVFFVPSKSLFPQSCVSSESNPTALQSQILWVLSFPFPDPQVGKSVVGPRTFLAMWEVIWYNCLQFVCRLLGGSMVGSMETSSMRAYATPRSAAPRATSPVAGHCWPIPQQETLKYLKAGLTQSQWVS